MTLFPFRIFIDKVSIYSVLMRDIFPIYAYDMLSRKIGLSTTRTISISSFYITRTQRDFHSAILRA